MATRPDSLSDPFSVRAQQQARWSVGLDQAADNEMREA